MAKKQYHADGWRLTDCCGAASKFFGCDNYMSCKKCGEPAPVGQGDMREWRDEIARLKYQVKQKRRVYEHAKCLLEQEVLKDVPEQEPWD